MSRQWNTHRRWPNLFPLFIGIAAGLLALYLSSPLSILAALLCVVIAIGAFMFPQWGLLLLIFMIYSRLSYVLISVHGLPSVLKPFVVLLLLAILFQWVVYGRRPENLMPAALILSVFALLGCLSLTYAYDTGRVLVALAELSKDGCILLILVALIQTVETLRRVVWTLLVAAMVLASISVFQYATGSFEHNFWGFGQAAIYNIVSDTGVEGYRIEGPGLGANGYGQLLLLTVPLALDRFWHENNIFLRASAAWAFFVSTLAVVLTFSRSAFLTLVCIVSIMVIRSQSRLSALAAAAFCAILLLVSMPPHFTDRLGELAKLLPGSSKGAFAYDVSLRGRVSENISAIQMFTDNPLLGVGMANYEVHYQDYALPLGMDSRREERQAHNLYLEILSELGLVGMCWFIAMQWITFRGLWQARRDFLTAGRPGEAHIATAIGFTVIAYLISGLFNHLAHPRLFWMVYGVALAVPYVAAKTLSAVPANRQGKLSP